MIQYTGCHAIRYSDNSDFTYVLLKEFVPFLDELPYKELRHFFTVEFEVADRMVNLSEGICPELFFFLRIFESQCGDTGLEITEVTEQLLKVYETLTQRYRASLHRLEEGSNDNSCFRQSFSSTSKES